MSRFIANRILAAVPLLLILSVVAFSLIRALPGDPIEAYVGLSSRDIDAEQLSYLREQLGLNESLPVQYLRWLCGWFSCGGEALGCSYQDGRPVLQVIFERLPASILLMGMSLTLSFAGGILWGLALAWVTAVSKTVLPGKPMVWSRLEPMLVAVTLYLYSIPAFLVGIAAIAACGFLGSGVACLPVFSPVNTAYGSLIGLIPFALLPALVLCLGRGAKVALYVRSLAIDEVASSYATMARAKGASIVRVMVYHVGRNCMLPVVNLLALSLPALLGGSVLIETIFGWPGTGRLAIEATFGRNYPVMTSLVMLYGSMVVIANLLADLAGMVIDPRLQSTSRTLWQGSDQVKSAQF